MLFETIEEALACVWALPFGIGKLLSIGGDGYLVTKVGQSIFGTSSDKNNNNNN